MGVMVVRECGRARRLDMMPLFAPHAICIRMSTTSTFQVRAVALVHGDGAGGQRVERLLGHVPRLVLVLCKIPRTGQWREEK